MSYCKNKSLSIYYEQHGSGSPVILIHGGTVNFQTNYVVFGWVECLMERGFKVVGLDLRGHGKSDKPDDVASYGTENLASDVLAVMDELDLNRVSVVGYSIGSAVALHLIQEFPEHFSKAALVATGDGLIGIPPHTFPAILPGLVEVASRSEYPSDLPPYLATYWNFIADSGGNFEVASAIAKADYPPLSMELASKIKVPVMVVSGTEDRVLGQGETLAKTIPNGEYLEITKADHFNLAAIDSVKNAIADYFS